MPRTSTDAGGTAASPTPSRAWASSIGAGELCGGIVGNWGMSRLPGGRLWMKRDAAGEVAPLHPCLRPILATGRTGQTGHSVADRASDERSGGQVSVSDAFWRGRRVFLTGHTGFKGAWLTLWLSALGAEVTGLSAGVPTEPSLYLLAGVSDDARSVRADVRDAAAVHSAVAQAKPDVL